MPSPKPKAREIKFPKPQNFEMANKCLEITDDFIVEKEDKRQNMVDITTITLG